MPQWVHPTLRFPIGQFEFLSTPSGRSRLQIDNQINHLTTIQGLGVLMPPFKVIYSTSIVYVVAFFLFTWRFYRRKTLNSRDHLSLTE
jgi:hypothetical protein